MTKQKFFDRDRESYFLDDAAAIGVYCKEAWPEEVSHILRIAEEVRRKEFLFDLKWDMERTYEPVIFQNQIQWDYQPGDDPEFIYQFNRHRFFICLGQAYAITGDEVYAQTFTELLLDWIQKMPLCPEQTGKTWRTIEAGLRGEYWCKALQYFRDSPFLTEEVLDAFYYSMMEHAEYLIREHSVVRRMSNWSILEDHGLFDIALTLPQSEKTREFARIALEHLELELRLQVLPDGMQWEQSPMYHNEVLHCLLDVLILAERNHIKLPDTMREKIRALAYADLAWVKPNHHQPSNGDSDDTDIRDLLSKSACLFQDPVLKFAGFDHLDFESVWDLGWKAAKAYEKLLPKVPEFTSIAMEDSGNYYFRSDWGETANYLHFHCGTLGAGHGHSDKLHFDLVIHGEDVLMDSGRYTYVFGSERCEFKDPMAHNTILVDDKLFTICRDSWECSKLSQPVNQKYRFLPEYDFVQGGHLGYMDLEHPVFINRKIIHIKPEIYLVADELYSSGEHEYTEYFQMNNQGNVFLKGNYAVYEGKQAAADFYFISSDITVEQKTGRLSRNYNQAEEHPVLCVRKQADGFASFLTVICGREKSEPAGLKVEKIPVSSAFRKVIHPDSWAEAVKITWKSNEYIVIICHQEVNTPTDQTVADGCMGFGNVLVFEKGKEQQPGTVLLY